MFPLFYVEPISFDFFQNLCISITLELFWAEKKRLIYNQNVDMACNFLGDEWFVDDLGHTLVSYHKEWQIQN